MLIVDRPFPPYSPAEYVPAVPTFDEELDGWTDEPEEGVDSSLEFYNENTNHALTLWQEPDTYFGTRYDGKPGTRVEHKDPEGKLTGYELLWNHKHSFNHREGDRFSKFSIKIIGDGGKKLVFTYAKHNVLHRVKDAAIIRVNPQGVAYGQEFHLYGVKLDETQFLDTHLLAVEHKVPLWVATGATFFETPLTGLGSVSADLPYRWVHQTLGWKQADWQLKTIALNNGDFSVFTWTDVQNVINYEKRLYLTR